MIVFHYARDHQLMNGSSFTSIEVGFETLSEYSSKFDVSP